MSEYEQRKAILDAAGVNIGAQSDYALKRIFEAREARRLLIHAIVDAEWARKQYEDTPGQ